MMMKCLILTFCLTVVLCDHILDTQYAWTTFKSKHGKSYNAAEETLRRSIFQKNYLDIVAHNEKYEKGLVTFKRAINKFSDLTNEEYRQRNGYKKSVLKAYEDITRYQPPQNATAPDSIDWRTLGAVTPIKDQGACGSCWAFSSTGALEAALFKKTGVLKSLSEQNLMDCSTEKYDNAGCGGGDMPGAIQYVIDNDGIDSEAAYPYEARQNSKCRYQASSNVTSAQEVTIVEPGNEELLKIALADVGPIAIAIDASNSDFSSYSEGVYFRDDCLTDPYELDHAVLLVGYGTTEDGIDYWIVKNSWAADWGEEGTIRVARKKNDCGITAEPIIPKMW